MRKSILRLVFVFMMVVFVFSVKSNAANASTNLALGTTASLQTDKEKILEPYDSSSSAGNAVDGSLATSACAARDTDNCLAWTLHDDLGSVKSGINRVVVTFDNTYYATAYLVMLSSDGSSWKRAACVINGDGGSITSVFEATDARYVRIRALKPDGLEPDINAQLQPSNTEAGIRMVIKELEVYADVDTTAPTASITNPSSTTNVRNDTSVILAFNEAMDSSTLNLTNIQLKQGGTVVGSICSISTDNKTFTITPNNYLSFNTSYAVTVNNLVKDKAGNPITGTTSWSFTTEAYIPLLIETTSSTSYNTSQGTSIYPAYVDNTLYRAWTLSGSTDYYQLKGRAGIPPYSWSLVSGALPSGLSLSSDGRISGTPTTEGTFSFRVRVTDSNNVTCEKDLVMEAKPYRGKWMSDAKFGFMVQSPLVGSYPSHISHADTAGGISDFESYITNFDADTWAQEIEDRGGKVLNFITMGGDDIRMWPSTTPSVFGYKTTRDIVGELITACQSRGIKFVAYLPGTWGWDRLADFSTDDYTVAGLHYDLVSELIDKGVDGFWFDSGGSVGNADNFNWNKIIPLIRTKNPDITIESNPGTAGTGYILQSPNTDIVTYEGQMSMSDSSLLFALPNTTKKKMGIEVANMLEFNWTWKSNSPYGMKSASAIINSIEKNWYSGATTMLAITPKSDGTFIPSAESATLDSIAAWVNANSNWCQTPVASLSDSTEYTSSQTVTLSSEAGATIYYTTDGSIPTTGSTEYTGPITINKSTCLQAIAVKSGKGNSYNVMVKSYIIVPATEGSVSFINSNVTAGTAKAEDTSHESYIGMKILVGDEPIVVDKVGRYYISGNSKVHNLKIVRAKDNYTVLFTSIDMSVGTADSNGFKYKRVTPVTLEAGSAYYIMSLEDSTDTRWNGSLSSVPGTLGAKIICPVWSDYSGTRYYISTDQMDNQNAGDSVNFPYMPGSRDDTNGQLLNIKFSIGSNPNYTKNLVRGAQSYLQDNSGNSLPAGNLRQFADLAIDGNSNTYAQAGNAWAWTLHVDLGSIKAGINKAVVHFYPNAYATEYNILLSIDGTSWQTAATVMGCTGGSKTTVFAPTDARYIRIRAIKPDGQGQTGVQMAIAELEVYNDNLALGATAALQDNNGDPLPPCQGIYYASNAVDGDSSTFAEAGNAWAWTLHVDLGSVKAGINKMIVNFHPNAYATEYNILLSTDGTNWTTAAAVTGCTGGSKTTVFAPTDARYIRIRAIKPDGQGQTGVQMTIAELEVYNDNLALGATATLQDNNGDPLPPCQGIYYASNAVDGDNSTFAEAGNAWAWTLHVDLGNVKAGINKVVVNFHPNAYATEYNILLSTDGTNWTTAASVANCEGGRSAVIFAPTDARYIRVRAIKPDDEGQAGVQMAIDELEVYKANTINYYNENALGTGVNQFNYSGTWYSENSVDCSNGTVSYSQTGGDYVTFIFSGSQIKWYSSPEENRGIAVVSIDNGSESNVDLYSPTKTFNQPVWSSPILTNGQHTFKIRVTGDKNGSSTGAWVIVDGVGVVP